LSLDYAVQVCQPFIFLLNLILKKMQIKLKTSDKRKILEKKRITFSNLKKYSKLVRKLLSAGL